MKSAKPLLQITGYYAFVTAIVYVLIQAFPDIAAFMPFGGNEVTSSGVGELMTGELQPLSWEPTEKAIRLALSLVGVIVIMEPVAGIEAMEIAIVLTAFFNYFVLIFWELDYGEEVSSNRWYTRSWMQKQKESPEGKDVKE